MAINYTQAGPEVHQMMHEILVAYHPDLEIGNTGEYPTICIMLAESDDPEETSPLKINGDPKAAIISIISYKQRADKRRDAELLIDAKVWDNMTEPQQRALLDHEATHLQVSFDEHGIIKTDDCGRPKLKMRLHDWTLTGFRSIAIRYGEDAAEVSTARDFIKKFGGDVLPKTELFSRSAT